MIVDADRLSLQVLVACALAAGIVPVHEIDAVDPALPGTVIDWLGGVDAPVP